MSATCAARSTAPATRGCSTRSAAPGTSCGRTPTDMRRPLSIHTRLTLWYTGVLLATLVVVSVVGYCLLAWNLAQDVDQSLLTVAVGALTLHVIRNDALVEVVQVGKPLAQRERTLRRYFQSLLVLVPLAVVLAASGGALMARAALRPVDQMSAAARRITAEALGQRV